ncbi:MAG TPA: alpha-L-arabinofuranosidase C-terminal domain-containing protein [Halococcus sp.]|nr:alpha-L-arabinofuranosidase C-terminal domain-containing protein [Halococcus sp.]
MVEQPLLSHIQTDDSEYAAVRITADVSGDPVTPMLYGKFTEHLGWNIYHGMDANTTFNPTFGRWGFREEQSHPDGGFVGEAHTGNIRSKIAEYADEQSYPDTIPLYEAFENGLAFWWLPHGKGVTTSADTNPVGDRAQRIETENPNEGIEQWLYLPVQRTDGYEYTVKGRARRGAVLTIALHTVTDGAIAETLATDSFAVADEWTTVEGTLSVDSVDRNPDALYAVSLTADDPANLVLDRLLLYPDDHINRADPDVVRLYHDADLPVLRWPGGNFVSGYDWRDGIGPLDERPTNVNPAWDGVEPNLFGTAEFVQFCREVGAEPTICVNAGDGTPKEAAKWVEYCNGNVDTEMGALRAEHGYEDPFGVTCWEVGNELWGDWQERYTTPAGNADRYERFYDAIEAVDADIRLSACGFRHTEEWNSALAETVPAEKLRSITIHPLAGAHDVSRATDAEELYRAFQGFPDQLREVFERFLDQLREEGVADPKLAVTELQEFAHLVDEAKDGTDPGDYCVTEATMPTPSTLSEALYTASIVNHCIRLGNDVELLTHSAAVNHGGGLRKEKERVFPDPVYHGQKMGIALAGGTPLGVEVVCDTFSTDLTCGEIRPVEEALAIDAMAVETESTLYVMLVVRPPDGPETITLDVSAVDGVCGDGAAEVTTLTADTFYAKNEITEPDRVAPTTKPVTITDGVIEVPAVSPAVIRVEVPLQ